MGMDLPTPAVSDEDRDEGTQISEEFRGETVLLLLYCTGCCALEHPEGFALSGPDWDVAVLLAGFLTGVLNCILADRAQIADDPALVSASTLSGMFFLCLYYSCDDRDAGRESLT